jgi:DNA-directed RNA polymerase specialized sigma24 family protein
MKLSAYRRCCVGLFEVHYPNLTHERRGGRMNEDRHPDEDQEPVSEPPNELWQTLFPTAIDLLYKALREHQASHPNLRWIAPALHRAYPDGTPSDELREVKGAVASAMTEFLRWQQQNALTQHPGEDELAYHLIRITYNRWKRRNRGDRKMRRATEVGQSSFEQDGRTLLSALPDKKSLSRQEFVQHCREVIVLILGDLNPRDLEIVQLYLAKETQGVIAERANCHRATVARVINRFRDRFKKILGDELAR